MKTFLTFFGAAVLHTRGVVLEAIEVPLAATVIEGLTLHGGHVEEVAGEEATTGSLLFRKPADLGDLWSKELQLRLDQCALSSICAHLHKN